MVLYMLSMLRRTKGASTFALISIIGSALSYAAPYLNGKFLDFLLANRSARDAVLFALFVALIGIGSALFSYFAGVLSVRVTTRLSFILLKEAVLQYERDSFFESRKVDSAHTTQRVVTDSNVIASFALANFVGAPVSVLAIPVVMYVIWSIDQLLALFSIILLTFYLFVVVRLRKTLYATFYRKKEADSRYYTLISNQLSQILNIQTTAAYGKSKQMLDRGFDQYMPKVLKSGRLSYALTSIDGLFAAIFQAVILIISGMRIINGTMTIGEYAIVGAYFGVLFKNLKYMMSLFKSYQDAKVSWNRTAVPTGIRSGQYKGKELDRVDNISLTDVNLSCDVSGDVSRDVLSNFTFTFSKPHTYCLVGENGRGKTSLLYLMLGLYRPSSGTVELNGFPIEGCDLDHVRGKAISLCPQECFAPDENVEELLEFLGTPYWFYLKEMGHLPTLSASVRKMLEKRCSTLSGGELRRVYLWSALVRDSSVLMLDEPTTGLDLEGRAELMNYIRRNECKQLIIIVSHDDEMIRASEITVRI